jgi:hypothetical protein
MRLFADARATERSSAVPGMDLDVVVEAKQPAEQRVVERFRKDARLIGPHQIGTANGADE